MIATGSDEQARQVAELLGQFIINAANHSPRSLQTAIGPSEIGDPCERKLSYKVLDWPVAPGEQDPIAPVIGTGFHAWMEEQFTARNTAGRYKIEEKVTVRDSPVEAARVRGSSDLYDRTTRTNYDWKLVGVSSLDKYRRGGPGEQYRIQAHLYGLGQENSRRAGRARRHRLRRPVPRAPHPRLVGALRPAGSSRRARPPRPHPPARP